MSIDKNVSGQTGKSQLRGQKKHFLLQLLIRTNLLYFKIMQTIKHFIYFVIKHENLGLR